MDTKKTPSLELTDTCVSESNFYDFMCMCYRGRKKKKKQLVMHMRPRE